MEKLLLKYTSNVFKYSSPTVDKRFSYVLPMYVYSSAAIETSRLFTCHRSLNAIVLLFSAKVRARLARKYDNRIPETPYSRSPTPIINPCESLLFKYLTKTSIRL